jgi:hypothetical protein
MPATRDDTSDDITFDTSDSDNGNNSSAGGVSDTNMDDPIKVPQPAATENEQRRRLHAKLTDHFQDANSSEGQPRASTGHPQDTKQEERTVGEYTTAFITDLLEVLFRHCVARITRIT